MPILQSRFLALLDASDDVLRAYESQRKLARGMYDYDLQSGRISEANKLAREAQSVDDCRRACKLLTEVIDGLMAHVTERLPIQENTIRVLERERTHFNLNKKRNDNAKVALRVKRGLALEDEIELNRRAIINTAVNIRESPLNKTPEEIDSDAREARERAEAWARGEDPDAPAPAAYTREDYERERDARLRETASPITVVRGTDNGKSES